MRDFLDGLPQETFQFDGYEKVDVNTRGFTGDAPLKIAVVRENFQIVIDLFVAGANPNFPGEDGCTPLHHACAGGNSEIVRLLLRYGASPSIKEDIGHTPVDIARILGMVEMLDILSQKPRNLTMSSSLLSDNKQYWGDHLQSCCRSTYGTLQRNGDGFPSDHPNVSAVDAL